MNPSKPPGISLRPENVPQSAEKPKVATVQPLRSVTENVTWTCANWVESCAITDILPLAATGPDQVLVPVLSISTFCRPTGSGGPWSNICTSVCSGMNRHW